MSNLLVGAGEGGLPSSGPSPSPTPSLSPLSQHRCSAWTDRGRGKVRCGEMLPWERQTCPWHEYGGSVSSPTSTPPELSTPPDSIPDDELRYQAPPPPSPPPPPKRQRLITEFAVPVAVT